VGSAMIVALAEQNHFKDLGDLSRFHIPMPGSSIIVDKTWLDGHHDEGRPLRQVRGPGGGADEKR
jgi:hypothetical protein